MGQEKRQQADFMRRGRLRAAVVMMIAAGALVVIFAALGGVGARAATTVNVAIQSNSFSPAQVTINVGDTVTWTNSDSTVHNTISNTGLWNSGTMGSGATFSHTFNQAGTFDYSCTIHGFTGRVIVQSTTSSTTSSTSSTTSSTTTSTTIPGSPAFVDVTQQHPFFTAIQGLANTGIINGYELPGGLREFRPQNNVLRAQFAKMIVGSLGIPVVPNAPIPFTDVERDAEGYPWDFVAAAFENHITEGRTPTLFVPYMNILRAQVTTMVVRALQQLHPGVLQDPPAGYQNAWGTGFSVDHGQLARIAEYNALLAGLPLTTTSANPLEAMSRGEVAQVLWNMMQLIGP